MKSVKELASASKARLAKAGQEQETKPVDANEKVAVPHTNDQDRGTMVNNTDPKGTNPSLESAGASSKEAAAAIEAIFRKCGLKTMRVKVEKNGSYGTDVGNDIVCTDKTELGKVQFAFFIFAEGPTGLPLKKAEFGIDWQEEEGLAIESLAKSLPGYKDTQNHLTRDIKALGDQADAVEQFVFRVGSKGKTLTKYLRNLQKALGMIAQVVEANKGRTI